MTCLYLNAIARRNANRPPVWFMRQAGRYHAHYQALRAKHSFIDLCKQPELACEVTFGPIDDFGFDAAILFSDLLFPLEAIGMGLTYEPGPTLAWHLSTIEDMRRLESSKKVTHRLAHHMEFQAQAIRLIRPKLAPEKALIGFVGGLWTLFCYAAEGSHHGRLDSSKRGLSDGRFSEFLEVMIPLVADNMVLQAQAGADAVAIFDTSAGDVDAETYARHLVPALAAVMSRFKEKCPTTPIVYYSKGTGPDHWRKLNGLPIACLGVDWNHDMVSVIQEFGKTYAIQGNVDPQWLHLPAAELEVRLREYFTRLKGLDLSGWICGLGHGVLQHTPEENVRLFMRVQREMFDQRGEA